jgi:hypothetical protein
MVMVVIFVAIFYIIELQPNSVSIAVRMKSETLMSLFRSKSDRNRKMLMLLFRSKSESERN